MIRAFATSADRPALPWWLGPGVVTCRFCSRRHPWEVQRRCGRCDAPFCPLCAGAAAPSPVCPGCGSGRG